MTTKTHADMARNIEAILGKHGFPENRVALPLEKLYESAHRDGVNFNKVLAELQSKGVGHEKTAEKIIFFRVEADLPGGFSMEHLKSMDFSKLSTDDMMRQASQMMQSMTPEQLRKIKEMYDNLSPEERSQLMNLAANMGK